MALRAAVLAVALVACAWFAIGVRQGNATRDAAALLDGSTRLPAAKARHAAALLHDAGQLNPDLQVDVMRGQLALQQGDTTRSRRILQDVVRSEPENLNGWIWLARSSSADPVTFRRALRRARALVPAVPRP